MLLPCKYAFAYSHGRRVLVRQKGLRYYAYFLIQNPLKCIPLLIGTKINIIMLKCGCEAILLWIIPGSPGHPNFSPINGGSVKHCRKLQIFSNPLGGPVNWVPRRQAVLISSLQVTVVLLGIHLEQLQDCNHAWF